MGGIAGVAFGGLGGGILGSVLGASVAGLAPSDQIERAKAEIARRKAESQAQKRTSLLHNKSLLPFKNKL